MPAQWPGNSVRKAARARDGGGFESAINGLPAADLYRNAFENTTDPRTAELNTINFSLGSLFNAIVTSIDGKSYRIWDGSGQVDPPQERVGVPDTQAYQGENSLLVSYSATASDGTANGQSYSHDTIAARRYAVRYWTRVPLNFAFADDLQGQHKWFYCYQDGYSNNGEGSTVWINTYKSGGNAVCDLPYRSGTTGVQDSYAVSGSRPVLFDSVDDRGRWMQLTLDILLESSAGANDGELRLYRRWDGESTPTKLIEATGLDLHRSTVTGKEGFSSGYIFNAREGVAAERQDFLVDNFELSSEVLV